MKKYVVLGLTALATVLMIASTNVSYAQVDPLEEIRRALSAHGILRADYLIGTGTAPQSAVNAEEKARDEAIADIYKQVVDNIRNVILASQGKAFQKNVAEYYSTVAQKPKVLIELPEIIDIPLSAGYVDSSGNVHSIVAVERTALENDYDHRANALRTKIRQAVAEVRRRAVDPEHQMELALKTYVDYETLKVAELIILGSKANPNVDMFTQLRKYMDLMKDVPQGSINGIVSDYFANHPNYPPSSIPHIAKIIELQFDKQGANPAGDPVRLDTFTYGIVEVPGSFGTSLNSALNSNLSAKWPIVTSSGPFSSSTVKYCLSGTYWEAGSKVTVRATLRDVKTGKFQASAILTFNKQFVHGIVLSGFKPVGYNNTEAHLVSNARDALKMNAIQQGGGAPPTAPTEPTVVNRVPDTYDLPLKVSIATQYGDAPHTVKIGEELQIIVKVNQAAHLRFISILPSGKATQLAEDMFIPSEETNGWVRVKGDFKVFPPTGTEEYKVYARKEKMGKFDPITETYQDGPYRYIGPSPPKEGATTDQLVAHAGSVQRASKGTGNRALPAPATSETPSSERDEKGTADANFGTANTNFGTANTSGSTSQDIKGLGDAQANLFVTTVE